MKPAAETETVAVGKEKSVAGLVAQEEAEEEGAGWGLAVLEAVGLGWAAADGPTAETDAVGWGLAKVVMVDEVREKAATMTVVTSWG